MNIFKVTITNHEDPHDPPMWYFINEPSLSDLKDCMHGWVNGNCYESVVNNFDDLNFNGWYQTDNFNIDISIVSVKYNQGGVS